MSRQTYFYFTPKDMQECEKRLRKNNDLIILSSNSSSPEPLKLPNTKLRMGKDTLDCYLCREQDISKIVLLKLSNKNWIIDIVKSHAIELSRSYFDDKTIRRGRLYCKDSYYDEREQLIKKDKEFIIWSKYIMKQAVHDLDRHKSLMAYLGKEAECLFGKISFVI